jgi:hypothetical protein
MVIIIVKNILLHRLKGNPSELNAYRWQYMGMSGHIGGL